MLCQPTPTNFSRDQEDGDVGRKRFCRSMTDNITCWPRTESGTFAVVSCPTQYDNIPFLPGNATKFCGVNGTWDRGSNYSECLPSEFTGESFSIHNYIIRIIYFVGFSASVFALFVALVIFIYYRCLWCLRNKIHCHLIATFILKNLLWLKMVSTITLLAADEENHVHQVVCKTMVTIFNYLVVTNFFWMLVEGLYLHTMIVWAFLLDQLRFWHYAFLGWCLPALIIICWAIVKLKLDDNSCWLPDSNSSFDYIFIGPIFWVLLVNLIFLASIVWILVTKLRTSNYPQNCLYSSASLEHFRKATRATLILFPLLGLTYLLFLWSPNDGQIIVFGYINSILQSTQGLFVATIYCFLNAEVQSAVKNHLIRWRDDRRLTILRTRTSLASNAAEHVSLQTKGSSAVQGVQATGGNELTPKNVDAGRDSPMNLPKQQDLIQIT